MVSRTNAVQSLTEVRQRKMIDGIIIYFWWNVWKKQIDEFSNKNPLQPRQLSSSSMQKWHTTISTRQKTFNR